MLARTRERMRREFQRTFPKLRGGGSGRQTLLEIKKAEATLGPARSFLADRAIRSNPYGPGAMKMDLSRNPPDVDLMGNRRVLFRRVRAEGACSSIMDARRGALTAAGSIHLPTIER